VGEPLFVSQSKLESWIDAGEVTFEDNLLTLLARKRSYQLAPASRISKIIDGKDDHGLLGRVLTERDYDAVGAEHYPGTLIVGDTGYECEEGFIGTEHGITVQGPPPPAKAAAEPIRSAPPAAHVAPAKARPEATPTPTPAPAAVEGGAEATQADTDMLVDFLLKHL
jgi:hypothetical protein